MGNRLFGFILVIIGFIFVVPNFGWFGVDTIGESFATFWPLFLIWAGVSGLFNGWNRRQKKISFSPLVAIMIGVLFLLDKVGIAPFSTWIVPGVLILFGVTLLFGRRPIGKVSIIRDGFGRDGSWSHESGGNVTRIKCKIGDLYVGGTDWQLKDTFIEQKVGAVRIDLTETVIPLGETLLEVECKMGDVDVVFPEGLAVMVEARVKIGSMRLFDQSNTGGVLFFQSPGYEEAERKVRMFAEVNIGDLDVKRA
ncbi:hypothetical protein CIG75_17895 [Tumebacillus algifaecis]|uniref:Uncharacterized protein n=1 Tax=Tumebacillus algifaecis TaxID=1214604 RepID=A0A223D594_9BACL|nr:cell wall-active antibiotics response protein LiaF [Tumebacillus algifaecis]ASS76657.1 hypothetical protein CIG75_17895 [Tumebacillus algifaecis]